MKLLFLFLFFLIFLSGCYKELNSEYYIQKDNNILCSKKGVSRNYSILEGASIEKFFLYKKDSGWARSDNNLFYFCEKIENIDAQTFEVLSTTYAKDNKNIYIDGILYNGKNIDIESFAGINEYYSKDKNNIYIFVGKYSNGNPILDILDGVNLSDFKTDEKNHEIAYSNGNMYIYGKISNK